MKKILFAILAVFAFASCSSDESGDLEKAVGTLTPGLYVYYNDEYAVAISTIPKYGIIYCEAGYITVTKLKTAEYAFTQTRDIKQFAKDGCAGWEYSNGLKILCVPTSEKQFTGMILKNTSGIFLPDNMEFTYKQ